MVKTFSKGLFGFKTEVLSEQIFGATDGVISTLAVIAGVAGATANNFIILVAGASAMLAEAISMGFSSYLGAKFREVTGKKVHKPLSEGVLFWLATMSGGFVPLIPFLISQTSHLIYSIMLSIIFLFAIGAYGAKTIGNDIIVTGARTAAIGLVAALITYYVGICFSMLAPLYG